MIVHIFVIFLWLCCYFVCWFVSTFIFTLPHVKILVYIQRNLYLVQDWQVLKSIPCIYLVSKLSFCFGNTEIQFRIARICITYIWAKFIFVFSSYFYTVIPVTAAEILKYSGIFSIFPSPYTRLNRSSVVTNIWTCIHPTSSNKFQNTPHLNIALGYQYRRSFCADGPSCKELGKWLIIICICVLRGLSRGTNEINNPDLRLCIATHLSSSHCDKDCMTIRSNQSPNSKLCEGCVA